MSLTNWLFGSLKKKTSEDTTSNAEVFEVGSDEGYSIIQGPARTSNIYPQVPQTYPQVPQTHLPYSVLPPTPQHSQYQTNSQSSVKSSNINSQIEGIQFRLASNLETHQSSNIVNSNNLKEYLKRIQLDMKNNVYDYNFKLENNIIQESLSYSNVHSN
uniref:UMA domain-containing protein n=1 Tax=Clastoptera arizonana TaxID=38151 RepID=A0A1B6DKT5_9HEMI